MVREVKGSLSIASEWCVLAGGYVGICLCASRLCNYLFLSC